MRKLFTLFQWAVVLALALMWARAMLRPVPAPDYAPESWSSWRGFHAISYAGVTREGGGDYVTPRRLASHLRALRENGFLAITPEDAEAFLQGRAPLPERAVLILFEGGRKDSYLAATPPLREFGQIAAMCVPTEMTRRWGRFYLRTRDLKKFAGFAHWRLVSMGHAATLPIPVGDGQEGRFLSRRKWIDGRLETREEYRARIDADFARAARILGKAAGRPIAGVLIPYADAGTSPDADPEAAAVIADAMRAHHRIAFTRADGAFNGPDSDPFQLTRIRVHGDWDARTLLDELAAAEPREDAVPALGGPEQWTMEGEAQRVDEGLALQAGGRAWLRGASDWSDLACAFRVERAPGATFALYARYAGPTRYVRIALTDDGARVQERIGTGMQTILFLAVTNGAPTEGRFTLRLKGNRLWFGIGDEPPVGPLPLTRFTSRGRICVESERARALVTDFIAAPTPALLVQAPRFRDLSPSLREDTTVWSPSWFTLDKRPHATPEMRSEWLAAAARGIMVIPRIAIGDASENSPGEWADALVECLEEMAARRLITRVAVPAGHEWLNESLRRRAFALLHEVRERHPAGWDPNGRMARDGDWILIDGRSMDAGTAVAEALRVVPPARIFFLGDENGARPAGVQRAIREAD